MAASPLRKEREDRIRLTDLHHVLCPAAASGTADTWTYVLELPVRTTVRDHRWMFAEPPDADVVQTLAKEINVPESIAKVLVFRGIRDYDRAKVYFRPNPELSSTIRVCWTTWTVRLPDSGCTSSGRAVFCLRRLRCRRDQWRRHALSLPSGAWRAGANTISRTA